MIFRSCYHVLSCLASAKPGVPEGSDTVPGGKHPIRAQGSGMCPYHVFDHVACIGCCLSPSAWCVVLCRVGSCCFDERSTSIHLAQLLHTTLFAPHHGSRFVVGRPAMPGRAPHCFPFSLSCFFSLVFSSRARRGIRMDDVLVPKVSVPLASGGSSGRSSCDLADPRNCSVAKRFG